MITLREAFLTTTELEVTFFCCGNVTQGNVTGCKVILENVAVDSVTAGNVSGGNVTDGDVEGGSVSEGMFTLINIFFSLFNKINRHEESRTLSGVNENNVRFSFLVGIQRNDLWQSC